MTRDKEFAALDARCMQAEAKLANAMRYLDEIRMAAKTVIATRYPLCDGDEVSPEMRSEEYNFLRYILKLTR